MMHHAAEMFFLQVIGNLIISYIEYTNVSVYNTTILLLIH